MTLDAGTLRFVGDWTGRFAAEWKLEVPMRIHGRDSDGKYVAADGTPAFSAEFEKWIERSWRDNQVRDTRGPHSNAPERTRVTRAFRKLRSAAPQEFLVLYDLTVLNPVKSGDDLGRAFRAVARRLNERAVRKGYPERYSPETVQILAFSAAHKLANRWF